MDRTRQAGQTLANFGQQALDNPLLTAGFGGIATSYNLLYQAHQRNDMAAGIGATTMAVLASGMVAAGTLKKVSLSAETLGAASNMVTGHHEGVNLNLSTAQMLNILNHLQDIGSRSAFSLHQEVRRAAETAGNDPLQLVQNLLELVTRNPPVLSQRPNSSDQTVRQHQD
ncbi:hypothetical protein [Ralstonia solanacearum]|uniref:hypothetical protein n=1 Tax=Ralstonia solanacearum TaxID=305 RepID=UPI00044F4891|nr:hypothetical protein [Ralstonia solanacearum]EUJ12401.1 hypothetical protein RSP673_21305 [Ralstonia solanacearum P673]MCL9843748.1 hypothetical protein [Ralstonia solanacearum]MCL9851920.1 hypothetical protein [Ralstonia solanacearum]MCL9856693.1 hypothetical protein [Ralstonia solanacearum]MCL9859190.1 hypothetical protein [Ralstonia solanacearum]